MTIGRSQWWTPLAALVDPAGAQSTACREPRPWVWLALLAVATMALGAATLPAQLGLLHRAFPVTGDPVLDGQVATLHASIVRLILADRLVPSPTLLVAAVFVAVAAQPVLMLPNDRRRAVWAAVVVALAPLVIARVGELVITYVLASATMPIPGDVIKLPARFVTGPIAFWHSDAPAPMWLELLTARVNLVACWCVGLWAVGLRALDGERLEAWHVLLPVGCLAAAGIVTWAAGPMVVGMVLR